MPVRVSEDDEISNAVVYRFDGTWNWGELEDAARRVQEWGRSLGGERYDVIFNFKGVSLPKGPSISSSRRMLDAGPSNRGLVVFAEMSAFISTMVSMGLRLYPHLQKHIAVTKTVQEARELILKSREEKRPEA
ncbi:MAG: hypothetical protein NZ750_13035 [Anaerolineae bacterium]|nr:hypothetical protein [Anaerolineae bacterium]MDW8173701.1 hypothetical protein [Anaerolineae bacterium]